MNLEQVQENWQRFAHEDPLWAILTHAGKEDGRWDLDEFLETGRAEIRHLLAELSDLGVEFRRGRALDFGCGVGRLTHALAEHFAEVKGIDIAPAMVERAREIHASVDSCEFLLNAREDLSVLQPAYFDLIYSKITLQHMHPRYSTRFIREFARVLAPGGVLAFQMPGRPTRWRLWLAHRAMPAFVRDRLLRWRHRGRPVMEMYGMSPKRVVAILSALGLRDIHVREDRAAGQGWTSFRYVAAKPGLCKHRQVTPAVAEDNPSCA